MIVVGPEGSGKTTLLARLRGDDLTGIEPTLGLQVSWEAMSSEMCVCVCICACMCACVKKYVNVHCMLTSGHGTIPLSDPFLSYCTDLTILLLCFSI